MRRRFQPKIHCQSRFLVGKSTETNSGHFRKTRFRLDFQGNKITGLEKFGLLQLCARYSFSTYIFLYIPFPVLWITCSFFPFAIQCIGIILVILIFICLDAESKTMEKLFLRQDKKDKPDVTNTKTKTKANDINSTTKAKQES